MIEEKDRAHVYNGIKYLSIITAVVFRTLYSRSRDNEVGECCTNAVLVWRITSAATSTFATVINTYWDIVVDWGLLRRNSKNPWLRDKLVVPYKSVYFIAMVIRN